MRFYTHIELETTLLGALDGADAVQLRYGHAAVERKKDSGEMAAVEAPEAEDVVLGGGDGGGEDRLGRGWDAVAVSGEEGKRKEVLTRWQRRREERGKASVLFGDVEVRLR